MKPEDRKIKVNPPYVLKIRKISQLGNTANTLLKGFAIKISNTMLNSGFREKLVKVVKENRGTIPLSMYLYDPTTKYNIEFMSKKFRVAVSNPFVNDLRDMNIECSAIRK